MNKRPRVRAAVSDVNLPGLLVQFLHLLFVLLWRQTAPIEII